MTKKFALLALVTWLAGSLVCAGAQTASTRPDDNAKPAAGQRAVSDTAKKDRNEHTRSAKDQDKKKTQRKAKPAPSREEQEFEKVLRGIYG